MTPYFTAFAYHDDTGQHRRAQRRFASWEAARLAAEKLVPVRPDDPWEWVVGSRGAARPTDHEAGRAEGDWQLVVRPHRLPNLRKPA